MRKVAVFLLILLVFPALARAVDNDAGPGYIYEAEKDARDKLLEIGEKEQAVIEDIFALNSEISLVDKQISEIELQIENHEKAIDEKELSIVDKTRESDSLKQALARIFKARQRTGAYSAIGLLLRSESLGDFLQRLNLLRDLSKNSRALIIKINMTIDDLSRQKLELKDIKTNLESQKETLGQALDEKTAAVAKLEDYMNSLRAEKEYYEEYLETIETAWAELKVLFSKTAKAFRDIIESGDMPDDTIELSLSLFSAKGRIYQEKFNSLLLEREDLPELSFEFKDGQAFLHFPEYEVVLEGRFELVDKSTIRYNALSGVFYNLPMSEEALSDLINADDLVFNLDAILDENSIRKIDHYEGYMELIININLF